MLGDLGMYEPRDGTELVEARREARGRRRPRAPEQASEVSVPERVAYGGECR